MEVLPVHSQLPSCLHPLSGLEGIGLTRTLGVSYSSIRSRSTHNPACVVQKQTQTDSPLFTTAQIVDPICFCSSLLDGHSTWLHVYGIPFEH